MAVENRLPTITGFPVLNVQLASACGPKFLVSYRCKLPVEVSSASWWGVWWVPGEREYTSWRMEVGVAVNPVVGVAVDPVVGVAMLSATG
jgi:hypothetical protein